MIDLLQIRTTLESESGRSLKEFLMLKTNELRDILNITEYTTVATQTLELKAQLRAYKKLKEIMEEIMIFDIKPSVKSDLDSYEVV